MGLKLPATIVTVTDLKRAIREVKAADEFIHQANLRKSPQGLQVPRGSTSLDQLCEMNGLNLLQAEDRKTLLNELSKLDGHAPIMHLSFATSPSDKFMTKIVEWFRGNIHGSVLLQVGLQPSIAGGCTLRTESKYFDFSLRQHFNQHQAALMAAIDDTRTS